MYFPKKIEDAILSATSSCDEVASILPDSYATSGGQLKYAAGQHIGGYRSLFLPRRSEHTEIDLTQSQRLLDAENGSSWQWCHSTQ